MSTEISPSYEPKARRIYEGGLRVKLTPPWPRDEIRAWVFTGIGYAGVYAPGYTLVSSSASSPAMGAVDVPGAGGHFFEIPLGIGVGWRVRKPWELTAELSGRYAFANGGSLYDSGGRSASATSGSVGSGFSATLPTTITTAGKDTWAIGLTIGVAVNL